MFPGSVICKPQSQKLGEVPIKTVTLARRGPLDPQQTGELEPKSRPLTRHSERPHQDITAASPPRPLLRVSLRGVPQARGPFCQFQKQETLRRRLLAYDVRPGYNFRFRRNKSTHRDAGVTHTEQSISDVRLAITPSLSLAFLYPTLSHFSNPWGNGFPLQTSPPINMCIYVHRESIFCISRLYMRAQVVP